MTNNQQCIDQWLASSPNKEAAPVLGKREIEIMSLFWSQTNVKHRPKNSAAAILEQLNRKTDEAIGLTTVQSTIERLTRKKLLTRTKLGRAYVYSTLQEKNTVISRLIAEISDEISEDDPKAMIEGFIEYFSTKHPNLLASLQRLMSEYSHASSRRHSG